MFFKVTLAFKQHRVESCKRYYYTAGLVNFRDSYEQPTQEIIAVFIIITS